MKFGIRFIDYLGSVRRRVELTVLAEQAGFDYAWYPHDTFMHNTWVLTSAAAAATSRIFIGSVGTNPFTTNPAEIATYIASLDELSGGRAVLGLGLHTHEMVEWTGLDASGSITATREATEIIRALLRGEVVDYQGEHFKWTDQCYLRLKPVRSAVPIYICAFGAEYLALSGAIGDGSLPMITPPESASYMVPAITGGALAAGRDPAEVDISGCAWLSLAADSSAPTAVLRRMVAYFGWALEASALATIGLVPDDFAPIKVLIDAGDYARAESLVTDDMCRLALSGTPRQVIEQIERLADLGVTQVNLGGPLGPDPAEAIRLMGEQVIPYFRSGT
ncbi:MAG: LLM class flavin-dependent oxidoreductase [Xanthomonadales bacterium]|nr:LLM class flavin-dependent oxidoreductase [Xanthomonadales bacterium]